MSRRNSENTCPENCSSYEYGGLYKHVYPSEDGLTNGGEPHAHFKPQIHNNPLDKSITLCSMCKMPVDQEPPMEEWEEDWDNFHIEEYGTWKIDRNLAKVFIRELVASTRQEIASRALEIVKAWEDEGVNPEYHRAMKDEVQRRWPTLYEALEKLTKGD